MDCPLLPSLPTDLAMLCLAKLPIDAVARGRAVSRAFASALGQYPPPGRVPQGLAAFCTGKEDDNSMTWLFLSRHSDLRSLVVPFFFLKGGDDEVCSKIKSSRLQVIGTGTPLLLVRSALQFRDHHMPSVLGASDCPGIVEDGYLAQGPGCLQGFDVWQMKWLNPRAIPWGRMPVDRWDFATAHFEKYVYFAGGKGPRDAACSAERLSVDTWTWETLPPMHMERALCPTAFAIGGRVVVVGGEIDTWDLSRGSYPQSGEFYDPTTNAWTLVPDMWPSELWWSYGAWSYGWPQSVAVVKDVAYALHDTGDVIVQLKMDSPSLTNVRWHEVGKLPRSEVKELNPGSKLIESRLLNVQDELWAIRECRGNHLLSEVISCRPHLGNGEFHWERLCIVAHSTESPSTAGTDVLT